MGGKNAMRRLRRLLPALAVVGALAMTLGSCQWPADTRYVHPVFDPVDEVEVITGITYRNTTTSTGTPIALKLDIYQPAGDTVTERPVVMWMFGGGWRSGDRNQLASYARDSASRGYVGVTIDYRIRPGAGSGEIVPAALDAYDDAVAAVQWLKDNAAAYDLDPDAIVAAGYSAGGINALNLLYTPGSRGPATSPVAGAVAIAGLSFNAPTAGDPPAMMHHGTADTTVAYSTGKRTCDDAKAVGDVCVLVTYDGLGHEIGATQPQLIRDRSADFIFEQILLKQGYPAPSSQAG